MFKRLRNKFIAINLVTTSLILIIAYSAVYIVAKNSADNRRPIPAEINVSTTEGIDDENNYFRRIVEERIFEDRQLALKNLLVALITTGLSVEILVAIFSFFFAEEAIKPVKDAYEAQKIFIANASHEIKTPIAAIKANLEAADLSEENHWIKNIEQEADKIESLNLALLKLAKTDAVKEAIVTEETNLKSTLKRITNSFSSRINQSNIELLINYELGEKQTIKLNRSDFKEITEILLDNAIKYCKNSIELTITSKFLSIKNDGTVIPEEKLPHIFDRFYQVDKSSNGSGLGLAIAKSLADRNNWHLKAESDKKSTSFTLTFN